MNILYDPETLQVQSVLYSAHQTVRDHHRALPNHVEHPEHIPIDEIALTRSESGEVVVGRKPPPSSEDLFAQKKLAAAARIDAFFEGQAKALCSTPTLLFAHCLVEGIELPVLRSMLALDDRRLAMLEILSKAESEADIAKIFQELR